MGIFNFFKKKTINNDTNIILDRNSLNNKSSNKNDFNIEESHDKKFDITNQNNSKYLNESGNTFVEGLNNSSDHILFSDEDYINDFNMDTSFYDDLIQENNLAQNEQIENENNYNVFNISDQLNNVEDDSKNVVENEIDYAFHKKDDLDNDLTDTENDVSDNEENNDTKKEKDLFAYLDDPFLVDNFLNRDVFSFQKFLDEKKKQTNDNENLVNLDDEDQRLQFISEIEKNIIDHEFQKKDLIDSAEMNTEHEEDIQSTFLGNFDDINHVEGDDLYKEKLPSTETDEDEEEIILDEIIIPTTKIIEKAPTNNFRDFLEKDDPLILNDEVNRDKYHNNTHSFSNLDDPMFSKDYIKNNSSFHHMENYIKEDTQTKNSSSKKNIPDLIEDFYDEPEVEPIHQNIESIDNNVPILDENSFGIKEKMLINEIKQKYEKEIVMDAKKKQDEIDKINKRPNFNDELLDLIKKGFPN